MYQKARESYQEEPMIHPEIFKMVENVKGGGDKYTQILGADRLKQHTDENEDIDFHSPVQGWQAWIKYRTFSDGVNFSKNAVEDNVANGDVGRTLKGYAATWGSAIRNEKETFGANIFNYGGYTSGDEIYQNSWGSETQLYANLLPDNKPFFNLTGNTRTNKGGDTFYNSIATPAALSPTSFETLYILVSDTNSYSEQTHRLSNQPDTLLTKAGADALMAKRILESGHLPGGELNDVNPFQDLMKPIKWGYLSGTGWYIGKRKTDKLEWHNRQKPVLEFYRRPESRGYRATVDCRWGVFIKPGAWRLWSRTAGSSAATK